jgi:hypothetical protein
MPDAQRVNQRFTLTALGTSPETMDLMASSYRVLSNRSFLVENVLHGLVDC